MPILAPAVRAEVDGFGFRWLAMPGPPACALVVGMVARWDAMPAPPARALVTGRDCNTLMRYDIRRVLCLAFSCDAVGV